MPAAAADCFATKWRTSGARSRISITEPSPMMVAPNMPGTLLICGPTGLTTISREPITVSMWTAARRSPARTINSGNWPVLSSVAYEVPKPSNSDNWCNWYCSPPYSIVRSPPVMRAVISSRGMRDTACTDVIGTANVVSPARTVIACVTASVNGKRMLKTVPRPRSDSMVSEPPSCRISLATTSMPTPRPDNWLTSLAVENPVCSTKLNNSLSEIGTCAIVGYPHQHFGALAADVNRDRTLHRLADRDALGGILDAVAQCIAQHVLERRLHPFQHVAVHFALRAFHPQLRAFAE